MNPFPKTNPAKNLKINPEIRKWIHVSENRNKHNQPSTGGTVEKNKTPTAEKEDDQREGAVWEKKKIEKEDEFNDILIILWVNRTHKQWWVLFLQMGNAWIMQFKPDNNLNNVCQLKTIILN
jgi:hypothetical protein